MKVRVGHSPDPDDAFMFYGFSSGAVKLRGYEFIEVVEDIESLNKRAMKGELEVTAVSANAYAFTDNKYYILSSGSSMGFGYGPMVVARKHLSREELRRKVIAIPGKNTTAYLLLQLVLGKVRVVEMSFEKIIGAVARGEVDAGLLIHEGQLTYASSNLENVLDIASWWSKESGNLPLPLGLDATRRDLGREFAKKFSDILRDSINYGLAEKEKSMNFAAKFARGVSMDIVEKFTLMYVNDLTLDMGSKGRAALEFLYQQAAEKGIIPDIPDLEII
ncbi:MAG: ABC transporter substrate-binding protein [Thaumarchaeota archaeon]|nr:ABC transporter substrate-binding protein [Nitrososphaerota archaeon]